MGIALCLSRLGRRPHDEVADFGHVFHGEADAFATEAAVLDSAVGHVVDPPGGDVADDNTADFKGVPRLEGLVDVAGKDAGLEAKTLLLTDA